MDERQTDEMTDAMLDQEIERALAVDPSPEFLARVRVHIATQPARVEWWSWPMVVAGAAVAVAAVVTVLVWRPGASQSDVPRAASPSIAAMPLEMPLISAPPDVAGLRREQSTQASTIARGAVIAAAPAPADRSTPHEPEVLIAADEAAALRRLMRATWTNSAAPAALVAAGTELAALEPFEDLELAPIREIAPIRIEPLQLAAREEGVRQ